MTFEDTLTDDGFVVVDAEELTEDELLEVVGGGCELVGLGEIVG